MKPKYQIIIIVIINRIIEALIFDLIFWAEFLFCSDVLNYEKFPFSGQAKHKNVKKFFWLI